MFAKIFSTTNMFSQEKTKNVHGAQKTWLSFWGLSGICLKTSDKSFSISASDFPSVVTEGTVTPLPSVTYLDSELKFGLFLACLH